MLLRLAQLGILSKIQIYKGYLRWNYANGTTRVVNDESEWIIVKSPLVPIIVSERTLGSGKRTFKK